MCVREFNMDSRSLSLGKIGCELMWARLGRANARIGLMEQARR